MELYGFKIIDKYTLLIQREISSSVWPYPHKRFAVTGNPGYLAFVDDNDDCVRVVDGNYIERFTLGTCGAAESRCMI